VEQEEKGEKGEGEIVSAVEYLKHNNKGKEKKKKIKIHPGFPKRLQTERRGEKGKKGCGNACERKKRNCVSHAFEKSKGKRKRRLSPEGLREKGERKTET